MVKKKVEKRFNTQNKKGLKLVQQLQMTKTQKDILSMLVDDYLTPIKIANLRGTSVTAVYKTINILKKKGVLNYKYKKVEKNRSTPYSEKIKQIRLHGQEFNIKIIKKTVNYDKIKQKSNVLTIDSNTIRLYDDSIEIYSGKSFFSDDVDKATSKSFDYWNRFFIRLENELNLLLVKNRMQNIKLVKHHYAYTHNELATDCNEKDVKIRLYATEDNKLWFEIDNSLNLNEAETVHTNTAKRDMANVVKPFFNDLRDNHNKEPVTMSGVLELINEIATQNKATAEGLNAVVKLLNMKNKPLEPTEIEHFKPDYIG